MNPRRRKVSTAGIIGGAGGIERGGFEVELAPELKLEPGLSIGARGLCDFAPSVRFVEGWTPAARRSATADEFAAARPGGDL